MYDSYNREITYLRISVTDKCNLRCRYCMPEEGVAMRRHQEFLSFEQITAVVRAAVNLGVTKVRLTGGEPLVKRGIVDLVRMIRSVEGLGHLAMTTNGVLLDRYAVELKAAGLDSLNISLDTANPERYRRLTRGGEIRRVLQGIEAALREKIPTKINMVVLEDTPEKEIVQMQRFCSERGLKLQLINHFALGAEKTDNYNYERPPRCGECNKIRLLVDGSLKPCLHSDEEIPVDMEDIEGSLCKTIARKPERGSVCMGRSMMEIGG
jgi:cyclic pyranopterin phosphate synthase